MSDDQDACAEIRKLLRRHGVPEAPFIDDHVRNVIVQRDALVEALTDCLQFCEIQRRRREHKGLDGPFLNKAIDNARSALRLAGVKDE